MKKTQPILWTEWPTGEKKCGKRVRSLWKLRNVFFEKQPAYHKPGSFGDIGMAGFTLGESVFLMKVFRLFRLEWIFWVFRVWTQ
jgi:hypothetical protein